MDIEYAMQKFAKRRGIYTEFLVELLVDLFGQGSQVESLRRCQVRKHVLLFFLET